MENEKLIEEAKQWRIAPDVSNGIPHWVSLNKGRGAMLPFAFVHEDEAEMIVQLATALAAATAREALGKKDTQMAFAWVVEHAESEQSRPRYYDGIGWSDPGDNEAAIRFAREKDARLFANKLDWPNVHRVCEHGWDEQIAAALSPAKPTEEVK